MALEFRKESLKKLNSPDDLDRLMPVTDVRGWVSLSAAGLFLITAIIWGFAGRIPVTLSGSGITTATGTLNEVFALTSGVIQDFKVRGGDHVNKGDVFAVIDQPDLRQATENAKAELAELESHQAEQITSLNQTIGLQSERLSQLNALVHDGIVEKAILTKAEQELMASKRSLYELQGKLMEARLRKAETEKKERWASIVTAPLSGTVMEVKCNSGDFVKSGDGLLDIEGDATDADRKKGLLVELYIATDGAKKIAQGMRVFIAPSTVKREEFGMMIGEVTYVSSYPKTFESIRADLNDDLARKFMQSGPPYKVKVRLAGDSRSYSGYRWTSGKGPQVKISSGVLCNAEIQLEERRPVELVIPIFRKYVLGEGT